MPMLWCTRKRAPPWGQLQGRWPKEPMKTPQTSTWSGRAALGSGPSSSGWAARRLGFWHWARART
eukprot:10155855-Lingulodinium_polyedra.AAC.1